MNARHELAGAGIGLLLSVIGSSAAAAGFAPVIDEFWIVKNSTEIFRDSFVDGVLPPSGPDDGLYNPTTYVVGGAGGFASESGGKLTITPMAGDPVVISGTYSEFTTSAVRQLATVPGNPNYLGPSASFEIHGLFDLSALPAKSGQSFGITATDRAMSLGNPGNESYSLFVGFGAEGTANADKVVVALRKNDYGANLSSVLAAIPIESMLPGADRIELSFSKLAEAAGLTASYTLYGSGGSSETGSIGAGKLLSLYDGETYVRGGFQSTDITPVPEPATFGLFGLGLIGLGVARRRFVRP